MHLSTLSEIQKQFLVTSRLFSDSNAYTIPSFVRIDGPLDEGRLELAWKRTWASAEILRSRIDDSSDSAIADDRAEAPWERIACGESEISGIVGQRLSAPFDLSAGPLVRFILFSVGASRHYALIIQHHIVTDLYSKQLLARALGEAYGDPGYRPRFEPYSRFVETEAAYLESEAAEKAKSYWEEKLRPFDQPLKLPHSSYSPEPFKGLGRSLPWAMPGDIAESLPAAEKEGRAPFLILLTAYAALLYRLSGTGRILIGVPLTNRAGLEGVPMLGPCVNILPVAVEINGESSYDDVYAQVRREMLLNSRHQGYPFMKLAELGRANRDPARPFLLQAGFTNEGLMELDLAGLECRSLRAERQGAQLDIFFTWWKGFDGYEGRWEYNSGSFGGTEIGDWIGYYDRLLRDCVSRPGTRVGESALLDPARAASLSGADSGVDYPLEKSFSLLLKEAMPKHPDRTALRYKGKSISYPELADRAASVASLLYRSFGQRQRIVVLLERAPEMYYALHGIVHSGNAYVPMGIDWPPDRIRTIIEDVEPAAVITQESLTSRLGMVTPPVFTVEKLAELYGRGAAFPEIVISPEDSMYILFTSGTTGKPKGADLMHRGIVNRILWMQDELRLTPGERVLLNTNYTFDVSVWQLFWPFLAGATVVVSEEGQHRDPRAMLRLIDDESVNLANFVPSVLTHVLPLVSGGVGKSLRDVTCSGEALPVELVARFFQALPGVGIHNLYGPTEASIDVTSWRCSKADCERGTVPIGRPISNTRIYVLDSRGKLCPPLVEGEIYISGIGLARSYWRREELTAKAFVPDAFGPGKMYKTGDAGRYALDSAIEYLGRLDDQLKIRGIRVESGEIESCVKAIPKVMNAALKKGATSSGEECLIVYYVSEGNAEIDPAAFRSDLAKHILASTIPEYYIRLDSLPMSENGKLNRKALPSVVQDTADAPAGPVDPGDAAESAVEAIWKKALGRDSIRHDQNYFDSGGHSLSLLKLRIELEAEFKKEIPIAELFANPTIAGMAGLFREGSADAADSGSARERAEKQRNGMRDLSRRRPGRNSGGD